MFEPLLGKIMEVHIDDMIVKLGSRVNPDPPMGSFLVDEASSPKVEPRQIHI